jgi:hypothetical protein
MVIQHLTIEDFSSSPVASYAVAVTGGVTLDDCVIRGSYAWNGVYGGSSISISDCAIDVPLTAYGVASNGGLFLRRSSFSGSYACIYADNAHGYVDSCLTEGGGWGIFGSGLTVRDSKIVGCSVALRVSSSDIDNCLIASNGPTNDQGIVEVGSNVRLANCTIVGNATPRSSDLGQATVHVRPEASNVVVSNNIFAFNDAVDFRTWSHDVEFTCNVLWQNDPLSHLGIAELDLSNIIADPLFCDRENGDYTLDAASPAATGPCGLIGAFPVGCAVVATGNAHQVGVARLEIAPNPFNPRTTVTLRLQDLSGAASLRLVDVAGREVRRLGIPLGVAEATVPWDGTNEAGRLLGSGVYYAVLETVSGRLVRPVVMAR